MNDISTDSTIVPADFDGSAFDDWIAGGTVAKRSVVVYGKPGLYAEYEALDRELQLAEEKEKDGAPMAGSDSSRIKARLAELYDEWMASKSTWILAALSTDKVRECREAEPALVEPTEPERPELPKNATDVQKRSHTVQMQTFEKEYAAYGEAFEKYTEELNLRCLAESVERIEFADGRAVESVTVDQLRAMRARIGELQVTRLATTATLATMQEPEIPSPFSRSSSEEDLTS